MAINKIKSTSIEDDAITSAKVADGVISAADVADGTITSAKLSYPLTTFSSTGIDDNATTTAITINSSETTTLQCAAGDSNFALQAYHPTSTSTRTIAKFQSNVGGTQQDKVVIQASGNVGIGTNSPASLGTNITTLEITGGSTIRQGGIYLSNSDKSVKSYFYGTNTLTVLATESNIPLAFSTNNTEHMRIDSDGRVLVGTTGTLLTSTEDFSVNGLSTFERAGTVANFNRINSEGTVISFYQADGLRGTISVGGSATAYNTTSDYRLKENVNYDFDATTRLKQLKPARFNFIGETDRTVDGFLAHEVSNIVPEAITGTKDAVQVWEEGEELPEGVSVGDTKLDENGNAIPEYQGIDQSKLVPLLVKTIQELEARITALENNQP